MSTQNTYSVSFICVALALVTAWVLNISSGSVSIPFEAIFSSFFGKPLEISSWEYILWNYRIPKAFTAILVGGGLSLSGLLMQTLFRNPLAGPFVLGISSGASLGAALLLMGGSLISGLASFSFFNDLSLAIAASLGSFLVLLVVIVMANR
ncbi:MAG: iron chelate uptake ABC transporter family permease subunit, partial [Bacteroidota bacterium]